MNRNKICVCGDRFWSHQNGACTAREGVFVASPNQDAIGALSDEEAEAANVMQFICEHCGAATSVSPDEEFLTIPEFDGDAPYPGDIQPGSFTRNDVVAMLRQCAEERDFEAVRFIADMMEE